MAKKKKDRKSTLDGGYGYIGNMATYLTLDGISPEIEKEHRQKLKKENPTAYKEYLEFEKDIKEQFKKPENEK